MKLIRDQNYFLSIPNVHSCVYRYLGTMARIFPGQNIESLERRHTRITTLRDLGVELGFERLESSSPELVYVFHHVHDEGDHDAVMFLNNDMMEFLVSRKLIMLPEAANIGAIVKSMVESKKKEAPTIMSATFQFNVLRDGEIWVGQLIPMSRVEYSESSTMRDEKWIWNMSLSQLLDDVSKESTTVFQQSQVFTIFPAFNVHEAPSILEETLRTMGCRLLPNSSETHERVTRLFRRMELLSIQ